MANSPSRFPTGYRTLTRAELRARNLPVKSEGVLTPSGDVISRRQAENIRFAQSGVTYSRIQEYSRRRNSLTGKKDFQRWAKALADDKGISYGEAIKDPEYIRLYQEAQRDDWKHDVEGPLAQLLTYVGLRKPDIPYDVGDTPTF